MGTSSGETDKLEKLVELNDELENYFNNTIIPQLFVDKDMVLRKFTPAAMKHFKLSSDDLGKHIDEVSNNIRFPTIIDNIQEVIGSNKDLEKEIQTTDKMWYQMNILPYIIKKENRTNGVIITFIDINDRIQILKGYEKLTRKYETIIHAISHDIKGPISNIEGLVGVLETLVADDDEVRQITDMLTLSVINLRKTVEELTHIHEGATDFAETQERVNFENLIEDAKLSLKDKIVETNAHITAEINESEISYSRKNARSIVYNLLSNAIKYRATDRPLEIQIKTEKSGDTIVLTVSDNGMGIEANKQDVIFNRYTRLRHDVEGTGVGLFIVKNMIEDAGGEIKVESTLGKGSTFKVYFQLTQ